MTNLMLSLLLLNTSNAEALKTEYDYYSVSDIDSSNNNSSSFEQELVVLNKNVSSNIDKAVIIIFDRGFLTQFTNAKPILDKYGFKASFFIICSFIDGKGYYRLNNGTEVINDDYENAMSWDQIRILQNEGHSIESHGMEHRYLPNLSSSDLKKEIAGSKKCLEKQDLDPTFFQFPNNEGAHNSSILKTVSEYFDLGLSEHSKLMFLNCDGWINHGFKTRSYKYQQDCRTFWDDGTVTRTNKYSIREWSHDRYHASLNNKFPNFSPHGSEISELMFDEFVREVELQSMYNTKAGKIVAIPIIGYHSIDNQEPYDTSVELFDREMKYLIDNGFVVLTLTDLGFNDNNHNFYIKEDAMPLTKNSSPETEGAR